MSLIRLSNSVAIESTNIISIAKSPTIVNSIGTNLPPNPYDHIVSHVISGLLISTSITEKEAAELISKITIA